MFEDTNRRETRVIIRQSRLKGEDRCAIRGLSRRCYGRFVDPAQPLLLLDCLLFFIHPYTATHHNITLGVSPVVRGCLYQVFCRDQALATFGFQRMCHPPGIWEFIDKTYPQNARTHIVILCRGWLNKIGSWGSRYFGFTLILQIPGSFRGESTRWRIPAQVLDLFSDLIAYRTSDDKLIRAVVLFAPTCQIILLPLVHDLAELSILGFVSLLFLIRCE